MIFSCGDKDKVKKLEERIAKLENKIGALYQIDKQENRKEIKNTLDFLQNRADSIFSELELAEEEFAKVKDINQRVIKASGRLKELRAKKKLEVLNARYLEIVKKLEMSKVRNSPPPN